MRRAVAILLTSLFAVPLPAQQGQQAPAQTQPTLSCRPLDPGNTFIGPDEQVVGNQACKIVTANGNPTQKPLNAQASASVAASTGAPVNADPASRSTANDKKSGYCVVLKRMGPADEVTSRMYSFGIRGKQFQYIEGDLPPGVKFHGRLTDNDVRQIQSKGGHVVIMEPKYTQNDLKEAKESCNDE